MEQCPKLALPCPNNCEVTGILREAMEVHRSRCPLEMVEYFDIGYQTEVAHQDMEIHNATMMAKHLSLTKARLNQITSTLVSVKAELTDIKLQLVEKDKMLHETLTLGKQNQWLMQIASESSKSLYGAPLLPPNKEAFPQFGLVYKVADIPKYVYYQRNDDSVYHHH